MQTRYLEEINNAKRWSLYHKEKSIPFTKNFEKALKEYEPCITKIERIDIMIVKEYNDKTYSDENTVEVNLETYRVAFISPMEGFTLDVYCEIFVDKNKFDRLQKLERICQTN